jgi:hypothetical protein
VLLMLINRRHTDALRVPVLFIIVMHAQQHIRKKKQRRKQSLKQDVPLSAT